MTVHQEMNRIEVFCPCCGPAQRRSFLTSNSYPIVQCAGCGLLFVGEGPPEDTTREFFRTEHITDQELTQLHYVEWRQESLTREADVIRQLMPEGGRLLDVGAASGLFIQQFQNDTRWKAEGVEPSRVSARFARDRFGLTVHEGFLEDQSFVDESFDVITSLDSFVCHRRPADDLREMYRLLKPGGLLAIEIGGLNFRLLTSTGLLCRILHGVEARLNAGVNYFYYSRKTLTQLAQQCGFHYDTCFPEAMPSIGGRMSRLCKSGYFQATAALYRLSKGKLSLVPKEFLIYRKPETPATVPFRLTERKTVETSRKAA